eukprot:9052953-Lingulodinium_polyedra.AAC.1
MGPRSPRAPPPGDCRQIRAPPLAASGAAPGGGGDDDKPAPGRGLLRAAVGGRGQPQLAASPA